MSEQAPHSGGSSVMHLEQGGDSIEEGAMPANVLQLVAGLNEDCEPITFCDTLASIAVRRAHAEQQTLCSVQQLCILLCTDGVLVMEFSTASQQRVVPPLCRPMSPASARLLQTVRSAKLLACS
jgi:hypothetical protein